MYKYGKRTGDYTRFKSARNKFVAQMHKAKKNYLTRLNPRDHKKFWKTVKHLNKNPCSVPTLSHNNVSGSCDRAEAAEEVRSRGGQAAEGSA